MTVDYIADAVKHLYLSPGGSDGNDGLSAGSPLLTTGAALNYLKGKQIGGRVQVNCADGTYYHTAPLVVTHPDWARIGFLGNTTVDYAVSFEWPNATTGIVLDDGFGLGGYGQVPGIDGITIQGCWTPSSGLGSGQQGIQCWHNATVLLGSKTIIKDFYFGVSATKGGVANSKPGLRIFDAGDAAAYAFNGGTLHLPSLTVVGAQVNSGLGSGIVCELGSSAWCPDANIRGCKLAGVTCIRGSSARLDRLISTLNTGHGILMDASSLVDGVGNAQLTFNGGNGLQAEGGHIRWFHGTLQFNNNAIGIRGLDRAQGRADIANGCIVEVKNNSVFGIDPRGGAQFDLTGATVSNATNYPPGFLPNVVQLDGSFVRV